jgi:RNA polymerase sigma factor (sigma-70 family)
MAGGQSTTVLQHIRTLFGGGAVGGLGEEQLLERFMTGRDEAAFTALVERHGPMVSGVCWRILADPHDVEDAFQATFLILAQKAGSIRARHTLGPWLYGVAHRVAIRAKRNATRRRVRERATGEEAAVMPARDGESQELRQVLDEELARIPAKYRAPVVLCYLEGRTHEEAARQLHWPVGTVKSRLAWAKERLRSRIVRRGLAPCAGLMDAILCPQGASASVPSALVYSTVRAATQMGAGKVAVGAASASVIALTRGVLNSMLISKFCVSTGVVLSTVLVATGAAVLVAQESGAGSKSEGVQQEAKPEEKARPDEPVTLSTLAKARVEIARRRLEAFASDYKFGRVTVDRMMDASRTLMDAEIDAGETRADRLAAIRAHAERLKQLEELEKASTEDGKGVVAQLEVIQNGLVDAEFLLAKASAPGDSQTIADLNRRLREVERKLDQVLKQLPGPGNGKVRSDAQVK